MRLAPAVLVCGSEVPLADASGVPLLAVLSDVAPGTGSFQEGCMLSNASALDQFHAKQCQCPGPIPC
eukprot:358783-Chlamydomonas_euryale.AAC.4